MSEAGPAHTRNRQHPDGGADECPGRRSALRAFAEFKIDTRTGALKLKRFVVVEDCGTIVNPMIVDGQVRGGVVQGSPARFGSDLRARTP